MSSGNRDLERGKMREKYYSSLHYESNKLKYKNNERFYLIYYLEMSDVLISLHILKCETEHIQISNQAVNLSFKSENIINPI